MSHVFNLLKILGQKRSSSIKGSLASRVLFYQRLSHIKCCFSSKVYSIKVCLPSKVFFHQRSSSTNGHPSLNVVFHQRLSSNKCHLPPCLDLSLTLPCLLRMGIRLQKFVAVVGWQWLLPPNQSYIELGEIS